MQMGYAYLQVHLPARTLPVVGIAALQYTILWTAAFNQVSKHAATARLA
jgi:hypothetical protein